MSPLTLLLLLGLAAPAASAPAPAPIEAELEIAAPASVGNLTIFPLACKAPPPAQTYLTLEEAFAEGVLTVRETAGGGEVDTLRVDSRSDAPIYALAGELLLGGKQDRIVGRNTLIPSRAAGFDVAALCVEHGRWREQTGRFATGAALAHAALRVSAADGQAAVWDEVRRTNERRKTDNATDTYRAALTPRPRQRRVAAAVTHLMARTAAAGHVAGVAVVIGGQVRAVDWFADPALYRKLEPKLLASYMHEALDADDGRPHAAVSAVDVIAFLRRAHRAQHQGTARAGAADVETWDDGRYNRQVVRARGAKRALHLQLLLH